METKPQVNGEVKFQHFHSSRVAMNMITPDGGKIRFVHGEYITADPSHIAYLDGEIAKGLREVTKGKLLTHKESDPMEILKTKIISEYLAEEAEQIKNKALGITKNMGSTEAKPTIKPMSSDKTAK